MRRLLRVIGLAGCALRSLPLTITPDSSTHHGGEFTSLIVAALAVLVLIPVLARPKS